MCVLSSSAYVLHSELGECPFRHTFFDHRTDSLTKLSKLSKLSKLFSLSILYTQQKPTHFIDPLLTVFRVGSFLIITLISFVECSLNAGQRQALVVCTKTVCQVTLIRVLVCAHLHQISLVLQSEELTTNATLDWCVQVLQTTISSNLAHSWVQSISLWFQLNLICSLLSIQCNASSNLKLT